MKWSQLIAVIVIAVITHLCLVFGLIVILPVWLAAPLVGAVVALITAAPWRQATGGTLLGLALGSVVSQPDFLGITLDDQWLAALYTLLGGLGAGVCAVGLQHSARRLSAERYFTIFIVAISVLLMWATALKYNEGGFTPNEPTVNSWLTTPPPLGQTPTDADLYLRVFYDTHDGVPYYEAWARVYRADPLGEYRLPNGVPGYRLPTLFYFWQLMPAQGTSLPLAFLLFATLAVGSGFALAAQLAPPRVAVLGAWLVAGAYLSIATSPFLVFVDGWAMAITLAGLALFVAAQRRDSRALLWTAVGAMLLAAAMREILLYPMLLAACSVLLLPRHRWLKDGRPWLVGMCTFILIYAAHAAAIAGRVDKTGSVGFWLNGGPAHLLATQRFFEQLFGGAPVFVPALVICGLVGGLLIVRHDQRLGAFLTLSVLCPHLTFLVAGSAGRDLVTGAVPGYWAMLVVPIALALAPVAIHRALESVPMPDDTPALTRP